MNNQTRLRVFARWANTIILLTQFVPKDIRMGIAHPNAHSPYVMSLMQKNSGVEHSIVPFWHTPAGLLSAGRAVCVLVGMNNTLEFEYSGAADIWMRVLVTEPE